MDIEKLMTLAVSRCRRMEDELERQEATLSPENIVEAKSRIWALKEVILLFTAFEVMTVNDL